MKKLIKAVGILIGVLSMSSCDKLAPLGNSKFGDFGYKGMFLTEYATQQITVEQAKDLVEISNTGHANQNRANKATNDNVNTVLTKYASLKTLVKYYISDREEQQVRTDIYQGTDFKNLLESNHYEPFGQMSVRYIFVDDDLLDDMEEQNAQFQESSQHIVSPFNEPYTYHTNEDNKLIVQTHCFAELPASTGGGIGSTFREDCELIFDEEGKITFWQSSLGLYTSTPTGTVREGYIFEVAFEWTSK